MKLGTKCPKDGCYNELNADGVMNALSRREGVGEICSRCGQMEALEDYAKRNETNL